MRHEHLSRRLDFGEQLRDTRSDCVSSRERSSGALCPPARCADAENDEAFCFYQSLQRHCILRNTHSDMSCMLFRSFTLWKFPCSTCSLFSRTHRPHSSVSMPTTHRGVLTYVYHTYDLRSLYRIPTRNHLQRYTHTARRICTASFACFVVQQTLPHIRYRCVCSVAYH